MSDKLSTQPAANPNQAVTAPLAIDLTTDKALSKDVLCAHGVPVPAYRAVYRTDEWRDHGLAYPLIVKPLEILLGHRAHPLDRSLITLDLRARRVNARTFFCGVDDAHSRISRD